MKATKKTLALILALVIAFSLCAPAFAAGADNHYRYAKYVALGDSIPAGYGPYNTEILGYQRVDVSYPAILADTLGSELEPLAYSAFRTQEMRYMLEDDYAGDEYMFKLNNLSDDPEYLAAMKRETQKQVAEADLITLQLGSNDIMTHALLEMKDLLPQSAQTEADEMIENSCCLAEAFSKIYELADTLGLVGDLVNAAVTGMYYGYTEYLKNIPLIVEDIYALNPDVTLVMVGMYNPVPHMKLTNVSVLEIGRVADVLSLLINTYLSKTCKYADDYIFVDIPNVETFPVPPFLTPEFMDDVITCVHPTIDSHKYIAQQILKALPAPVTVPYKDVASDAWYFDGVKYVSDNGLMSGLTEHCFCPNADMTRAQFAEVLYKLAGSPSVKGMSEPFLDVTLLSPYRSAIVWAYNNGITNGISSTRFAPYKTLTRAQAVTMLYRFAGQPAVSGELTFTDVDSISEPYVDAVLWATQNGIIIGYPDGSFAPDVQLDRAQLAVIVSRFCNI